MWYFSNLLLALTVIIIFVWHELRKRKYFKDLGIVCQTTWPLFGALPTIMMKGVLNTDQDGIRKYGKIYGSYLGNMPTVIITDLDMIKEILVRQFHNFPYRMKALYVSKWWENGVVIASGDHWKYLRTLLCPTFSSGKLKNMQPVITKCMGITVSNLKRMVCRTDRCIVDLRKVLSALTMDIICQTSFGIQTDTQSNTESKFSRNAKIVSTLSIESNPVNVLPLLMPKIKYLFELLDLDYVDRDALNYFKDLIKTLVSERNETGEMFNDTLQHLMDAHKENGTANGDAGDLEFPGLFQGIKTRGLTEDELVANALIVLMAGHDTTATTLTWMCYLLATHQDIQDKLIREMDTEIGDEEPTYDNILNMKYLDMFLSETLRLYPAANRTGRDAVCDTKVCGYNFPVGASITIPIYALHRMPEYWREPNKCIPERFAPENRQNIQPFSYIPYGAGPRACIGIRLAQMLCKLIIVKLLQNFRLNVTEDQEMPPVLEKSLLTKPTNGMTLELTNR